MTVIKVVVAKCMPVNVVAASGDRQNALIYKKLTLKHGHNLGNGKVD